MKKTVKDFDLNGKRVIVRVDFNVPMENGIIKDDTRIVESLKTITYLLDNNAKIILLSHLGRIKSKEDLEENTLMPVAKRLGELLNKDIIFIKDLDYETIKEKIEKMKNRDIVLLENTRFYDLEANKESSNNNELAEMYASLGDIFINDAFGTIHRNHASNVGIASILPSGIGFLVEKELKELLYLNNPDKPYVVILGGSKVSDKIKVIEELVIKCDKLIIGGAMAFTFLKSQGFEIGKSKVENEYLRFCQMILDKYKDKIVLPIDIITSKEINGLNYTNKQNSDISIDDIGLDLGLNTIDKIKDIIKDAKTVFWNGPLGYYEIKEYMNATKEVLTFLVENNIKTILGGGDIVACSAQLGLKDKVYHASTGGGATLEYLEGKELPGLKIIQNKE